MAKQPLPPVRPPRRPYRPRYPGYADPNPLEHPETRPYPFTNRFVDAVKKGGLAGALLLGGGAVKAQSADTLYNPFPLESAGVPYRPVMFGTGLPERLSTDTALAVIQRVFAAENINLDERVEYTADGVSVFLDGYDTEQRIGFVLLSWGKMDGSFELTGYGSDRDGPRGAEEKANRPLAKDLAACLADLERENDYDFARFVRGGEVNAIHFNIPRGKVLNDLRSSIAELPREEDSRTRFDALVLEYALRYQDEHPPSGGAAGTLYRAIRDRIADPRVRYVLYGAARNLDKIDVEDLATDKTEWKTLTDPAVEYVLEAPNNAVFTERLLQLTGLLNFTAGVYVLRSSPLVDSHKLRLMRQYPPREWYARGQMLLDVVDLHAFSYSEVERIDEDNKNCERFIAPISMLDDRMIVHRRRVPNKVIEVEGEEVQTFRYVKDENPTKALEDAVRRYIAWARQQMGN